MLKQIGGSGKAEDIINKIYPIMKNIFTEKDLKDVPSQKEPRWRNEARWERNKLVKEGLLSDASPYGVWEITPEGYKYLNKYEK